MKASKSLQLAPQRGEADVEQIRQTLMRYCISITGSIWDAEDLVQETCLKAMSVITGEQEHVNPEAYLFRIARNKWIDQVRKKQRAAKNMNQVEQIELFPDILGIDVEAAFVVLLKHVSPLQRTVFLLRDIYGFSGTEVAKLLETTEGAVKTSLHRARITIGSLKHRITEERAFVVEESCDKAMLMQYVSAFRTGDTQLLVQLVQHDLIHPVVAVGMLVNRINKDSSMKAQNKVTNKSKIMIQCSAGMAA